jgi:hypothetical protein
MTERPLAERLEALPDETVVSMLLSHLYRIYDAGGISCGRSWESRLVEPAMRLMDRYRPKVDIVQWPDREATIREAEDRLREAAQQLAAVETRPEVCICAAIKTPSGEIWRGHRHNDCIRTAGLSNVSRDEIGASEQGFITSRNRFVSREEAARLQAAAGVVSASSGKQPAWLLFSEDLYLRDWRPTDGAAVETREALHDSAPKGYKCADCSIDGEPCPRCYATGWRKRHPNVEFVETREAQLQALRSFPARLRAACYEGHVAVEKLADELAQVLTE